MTRWLIPFVAGVLIGTGAHAEPDEATKRAALLWAYEANGYSMVSWTAWDYEKRQRVDFFPREVTTPQPKQDLIRKPSAK
jgi:hypothetical protein